MELRHLRYFLAVAEEGSFTRAAARLGMSQPPLSQQMRDLEKEIGVPLFERLAQGVTLTEAGRVFLLEARSTIERAERAKALARRAGEGATGLLRIGITATATFNPLPAKMVRSFRRDHPDVAITMEDGRSIRLVERLLTNELDAVFVRPSPAFPAAIDLSIIDRERLIVALCDDHPLASRTPLMLGDLADDAFIVLNKSICASFYDASILAARTAGFELAVAHQAVRLTSIIDMVAGNLGVALVPQSLARVAASGVRYRKLDGDVPSVPLALVTRTGELSIVVQNFLNVDRSFNS